MKWYAISVPKLIEETGCRPERGLSEKEAARLQTKYGPNELAQEKGPGLFARFAGQFKDFMILTLLAAALISFLASYIRGEADFTDPCIILAIVIINAMIGVYQEKKAEHSLEALRSLQTPRSTVLRSGKKRTVPSSELVPGDVVCIEAGSLIPADGRLLTCHSLSTEESALTGETGAIRKTAEALPDRETAVGDRINCVFSGTMAATGRGTFYVTATGMNTQIGQIAGLLARESAPETPLTRRLNKTGRLLGFLALAICAVVFFLGVRKNQPVFSMFMTSVSLGVAAIPESLPALVTIMLSLGVERMARQKAVIRHLPAVETLGSASVICSDKTGTLTENKMAVRNFFCLCEPSKLARLFALCNDNAGPMEQALTEFARTHGVTPEAEKKSAPRIFEIPFDSLRRKMTTLHDTPEGFLSITKGAPEIILADSTHYEEQGILHPMTPSKRKEFLAQAEQFASQSLRVLAIGYRLCQSPRQDASLEQELVFTGLAGLMDPPRREAYAAVKSCKAAGILPVMITGDHRTGTGHLFRQRRGDDRPGDGSSDRRRIVREAEPLPHLCKGITLPQGAACKTVPPTGKCSSNDRRRRERRAGAQGGRHRLRHGKIGNRRGEERLGYDPDGRQFFHNRGRRPRGARDF